jgi:hypothetical protein
MDHPWRTISMPPIADFLFLQSTETEHGKCSSQARELLRIQAARFLLQFAAPKALCGG